MVCLPAFLSLVSTITAFLLAGGIARSAPADNAERSNEQVVVVAIEPADNGGWKVGLHFAADAEMPVTLTVEATGIDGSLNVRVDDDAAKTRNVALFLPHVESPLVATRLLWADSDGILCGAYLLFIQERGELIPISYNDAVKQLDVLDPPTPGPPHADDLSTLSPLENPALPEEDRAYARQMQDGQTVILTGALTAAENTSGNDDRAESDVGCSAGADGALVGSGIVFLFALAMRKRFRVGALLMGFIAIAANESRAAHATTRTVYGYVVYWDSRGIGSNAVGSRISSCDMSPGMQNCVAGSANCCFRAMDGITITVVQNTIDLASQVTNSSGFYALTFNGNDALDYHVRISYYRPSGSSYAGALQEVQLSPPLVLSNTTKVVYPPSTPNYWAPDFRINSGGDTTSPNGDRATIWATVTETQRAIASEGDTRYRHLYGASQTGPDDFVTIDPSGGTGSGSDCPTSLISLLPSNSRILFPATYMATIYRGRVVGCSSVGYSNLVVTQRGPAFPPSARSSALTSSNSYTGEGIALGSGLDYLSAWLLRRWRPADTAALTMASAVDCTIYSNSPLNQKGNSGAWGINNARGLWEWLDTPVVGTMPGVDNSDITLTQLMDGLVKLQSTAGTLDGQAGEASFTPTATQCTTNEQCSAGDACAYQQTSGTTVFCASGDPNGSNIEDVANALNALSTPGRGSLLTTLTSTDCMQGGADNVFAFDQGYVDN